MQDATTATQPKIDPDTGQPVLGPDQKPVIETVNLQAGLAISGTENYTLPKNVTVIKASISNSKLTIGRYAYLGDVPRFATKDLEMFASKMSHTLRVKAWVTQDTIDQYEETLLLRWMDRYNVFMKSSVHLIPMQNLQTLASQSADPGLKKMYQVASYYSPHYLDNTDLAMNIYDPAAAEADYRDRVLTEILRKSLNNNTITIQDGMALANQYAADPLFYKTRAKESDFLFQAHLGSRFVSDTEDSTPSRLGYLTFVYPIAIDVKGPFGEPNPGIHPFPLEGTIEARWWSDRWQDEFGGFPFLLITEEGVAFHGPITLEGNMWMLRRANVSHSCMRMDPSDILELRELLPRNILSLERLRQTIPLHITEWPDVDDLNHDGNFEAVDVNYYITPGSGYDINNPGNWKPRAIQKYFWNKTFSPYSGKLPSKNTFTVTSTPDKDNFPIYQGTFTGLPQYTVQNNRLVISGYYRQPVPIQTYYQRPTSIIQYREDGVVFDQATHDLGTENDSAGQASPLRFEHGI